MTEQAGGHVSEREARAVAEAARETEWRKPSFAKELYLGRFRLDLIHPHPASDPAAKVAAHLLQPPPAPSEPAVGATVTSTGRSPPSRPTATRTTR